MNLDMKMGVAIEPVRSSAGAGMQKQPKIIDKLRERKKKEAKPET
jgi:hypothetical protein